MNDFDLATDLAHEDATVRTFAAEDAGERDREEDVALLVDRLVVEPELVVREALVGALMRLTSPRVSARVASLLASEDAFVRNAAVRVLRSRVDESLDVLSSQFPASDVDVRKFVVDIVSASSSARATELLIRCLDDADVNVRIAAVEALGERSATTAVDELLRIASTSEQTMLVAAALGALETLADERVYRSLASRFPHLEDVPIEWALPLLRLYASVGPASIAEPLLRQAVRVSETFPSDAVDIILTVYDRHPFDGVPPDTWDALAQLAARAPSPRDRSRLLRWLGGLTDTPGLLALLIAELGDPSPMVRLGAVAGLVGRPDLEARAALRAQSVSDPDSEVRGAIAVALAGGSGAS